MFGVAYLYNYNFDCKQIYVAICLFIEPFQSIQFLLPKFFSNPNDARSIFSCCIGDCFSEMVMVCRFKLIFNDNFIPFSIFANNICPVATYWLFPIFKIDFNANGIAKKLKIVLF